MTTVFRDDKCVWVGTEQKNHWYYRTSCGQDRVHYFKKYKYCPFCRKIIRLHREGGYENGK